MRPTTSSLLPATRISALLGVIILVLLMVVLLAPPAHAAPSTFTVNSTADLNDLDFPGGVFDGSSAGVCDADAAIGQLCTLRAAIQEANANNNFPEADRINFNIPDSVDPGVKTISPGSSLPVITDPVVINGYSQPGSSANTLAKGTNAKLLIQITPADGFASAGNEGGLTVGASNSAVKGLVINRFPGFMPGVEVSPLVSRRIVTNVRIAGNFLGTNHAGTKARGNGGPGVRFAAASDSTIGGTSRASRNLISGNKLEGIFIQGGTTISGLEPAENNEVQGNLIGTKKDGISALGNGTDGVGIFDGGANDANGNTILSNSIFANGDLGIDLGADGPTANDPGDTDTGPNRLQNKPSLRSAKTASRNTTIKGTLNSRPGRSFIIQFFSNPSGNEGRTFIGSKSVSTDGSGKAPFTFSPRDAVAVGRTITATATRDETGDTSEFSAPRTVASS